MAVSRQRVPYFERPKAPRDWRWTVGLVGRILIVSGLMMFAFVAYQLWGTGIQTAQAQNDLDRQFQELLQSASTSTTTSTTSTSTTAPTETTEGTTTTSTIPVAPVQVIGSGTPVAQLHIDAIDLNWTVVEGVGVEDLKQGPGHFPETPMPGQLGNAAIAGHRTTHGQPFFRLDELKPGDLIRVETLAGTFVYAVTGSTVVNPSEISVIATVDPDTATLTLTTCTPKYTARQRLVVRAVLVPDQSSAVMRPPSATTPDDATSTTVAPTLPGDETTVPSTDSTVSSSTTTTTVVAAPDSTAGDSFSGGWFDDTGAILPSILWGLVLVGVVVGAWRIGKKANRLWVCYAVGAVPFVVVLYFFFENINRLLPPGL